MINKELKHNNVFNTKLDTDLSNSNKIEKEIYVDENYSLVQSISLKPSLIVRVVNKFRNYNAKHGKEVFPYRIRAELDNRLRPKLDDYNIWIYYNERNEEIKKLKYNPLISVVIPVYNVQENELRDCINSVLTQTYQNFELILVDDHSTYQEVLDVMREYESNPKIKTLYHEENKNISQTTNDGIEISKGEFIAFMDCDDILAKNALYEVALALNNDSKLDFIYSDEDKICEDGTNRHAPFFKPDWSKDTFLSIMYTSHLGVYRKSIVDKVGGLTVGLDGAQDYDFTLRFIEHTDKIYHIPQILYHRRERKESIASNPEAKLYALNAVEKLKLDYLKRNNIDGFVEYDKNANQHRVVYNTDKKVSIIIPSKDNVKALKCVVKSIREKTDYPKYEIIVVDNGSSDTNKIAYEKLSQEYNFKYLYSKEQFNFSKMCNDGARAATGEILLFLNDDVEILHSDWLARLAGAAIQPHIGAVGAKLYYPNTILMQHVGIANLTSGPSHLLAGCSDDNNYYFYNNSMDYNYIAVTGAALAIETTKFEKMHGFDENFAVTYNDVDLCMKLVEAGFYNVLRNDVRLYHYESLSRGDDIIDKDKMTRLINERNRLYSKHSRFLGSDPFYSVNLDDKNNMFKINTNKPYTKISLLKKCAKKPATRPKDNVIYSITKLIQRSDKVFIDGFAFFKDLYDNNSNNVKIILQNENESYCITPRKYDNNMYSNYFNIHADISNFRIWFDTNNIIGKIFNVCIGIQNKANSLNEVINTGIKIEL